MKKILVTLYFLIVNAITFSQHLVTFVIEDAYTFERIENAKILVDSEDASSSIYLTNESGTINFNNEDEIRVIILADGYSPIQSRFTISKPIEIKAILQPKKGYECKKSNQKGVLIDAIINNKTTGKPIPNAKIVFPELKITLISGKDGRFLLKESHVKQLNTIKEGDSLTMEVSVKDYETRVIQFRLSFAHENHRIALIPLKQLKKTFSTPFFDKKLEERIRKAQKKHEKGLLMYDCDNLPSTIRVGTACSCNDCTEVEVMDLEIYVQKGLNDEWIASWHHESLKAGSLPYKTYGAYYVQHPIDPNYDISSTTCKQVWDDDFATSCINAATETEGEYLITSNNEIAFSEYSAENNGLDAPAGEGCGDGYAGTGNTYPCIEDHVCSGHSRFGHGRGMCQWGSQRWALQGKDYQWIADHYYNPVNIYRCNNPIPSLLDCSNAVELACGISYHGEISAAPSNVTYYGCNNWTETGPERVHTITPMANGTITATISNFTGDLDVYILGSCDPNDCLGTVNSADAFYDEAQAGYTYYIVVDADDGSGSAYDLIVECPNEEDVLIANAELSDAYINSGDETTAECDFIYGGTLESTEIPMLNLACYLSEDCLLDNSDILLAEDSSNLGSDNPIEHIIQNLTIPADTDTGNYFILFVADVYNEILETNEENNIVCKEVFVNLHENTESQILGKSCSVFPNPTDGLFTIKSENKIDVIEIYSSIGKLMAKYYLESAIAIDISNYSEGIYFVKIIDKDHNQFDVLKLIKQ